jgi:hypothetical protein
MSGIYMVYPWNIPGISCPTVNHAFWVLSSSCPEDPCSVHVFLIHLVLIASLKSCKTKGSLKQVYVTYIPCIYMVYVMYYWGAVFTSCFKLQIHEFPRIETSWTRCYIQRQVSTRWYCTIAWYVLMQHRWQVSTYLFVLWYEKRSQVYSESN